MKKIITLCLFVFALFLGTQTTVAQNSKLELTKEANAEAAEKTEALRKYIKFDNDQRDQIYEAIKSYTYENILLKKHRATIEDAAKKLEILNEELETKMKTILSPEQFDRYRTFPNN